MAADHPALELLNFIIGDFEAAWDALAARPEDNLHRGNFMFGRQAMMLLEFACRLCKADKTGQALADFSNMLACHEPRYFTRLPGICVDSKRMDFALPRHGPDADAQLIAALFDLIRHGQAHQYQQARAHLDGGDFRFALTGAQYGLPLRVTFANGRPSDHLEACRDQNGDIRVTVRTDVLFLDLRDSVRGVPLFSRDLPFGYQWRRSSLKGYGFTAAELWQCLQTQGH
jgi:hypothetical protein